MRVRFRLWKVLGLGLLLAALVVVLLRSWILPALLVSQIEAQTGGRATIGSWWLGGSSAGLTRLALYETRADGAPLWAAADRVGTDLSLQGLLRGQFLPRRITIDGARLTLRLDRAGKLLTPISAHSSGGSGALPTLVMRNAEVTIRQEGRPELTLKRIQVRLASYQGKVQLAARSDDPDWGPVEALGEFANSFRTGRVEVNSKRGITVDPAKVERIPFVPPEVWTNVLPDGTVDAQMTLEISADGTCRTRIEVGLRNTRVKSTALNLTSGHTSGKVVVDGARVTLEKVAGDAIGGRVEASGTLDFSLAPPQFDLSLGLQGINVADAPKSWQLDQSRVTGRLAGTARLKAALLRDGIDLSGSTGEAEVTDGSIQGIPVKALKLVMHADRNELRYESKVPGASELQRTLQKLLDAVPELSASKTFDGLRSPQTLPGQPKSAGMGPGPSEVPKHRDAMPKTGGFQLPRSITTKIALQDVDLSKLVARSKLLLGSRMAIPVSGKLDLKAEATIPLGALRELKDYVFHGELSLRGASIFQVDVGTLAARLDLAGGVLELSDLRGQLVDRPDGGPGNPPPPASRVPREGPLPPGAFRGSLRAEVSPPGRLNVRLEGNELPLGEVAAPVFPPPTPVSGLLSLDAAADATLANAADPKAWSVRGRAQSVQLGYQASRLDSVALGFTLRDGRLNVSECTAKLKGRPLSANLTLELSRPYAITSRLDMAEWDIAALAALIPSFPQPAPIVGSLSAHAEADGTLFPANLTSKGEGRFGRFQTGPVPLGDVTFRWATIGDTIVISDVDAHPFGGRIVAEARVPTVRGRPIEGSATLEKLDMAGVATAIPGQRLKLSGEAGGKLGFAIASDISKLETNIALSAPTLKVDGIPVEQVQASLVAHKGVVSYVLSADSLGGRLRFDGSVPLADISAGKAAEGELRATDLGLEPLWKALGLSGAAGRLEGVASLDANIRAGRIGREDGVWAHGLAELRDLSWGKHHSLGQVRGTIALMPDSWWIEPLEGGLFGGLANGRAWGTFPTKRPAKAGFELRIDRAALHQLLAFEPELAKHSEGFGTLRMAGEMDESCRASAELDVTHGRIYGVAVSELRAPAELVLNPTTGTGQLHVRHWNARIAGGRVRGNALLHVGTEPSFQGEVVVTELDLESVTRLMSDARRTESGRITGRIGLSGHHLAHPRSYRGRVDLALSDASLISLPVVREIDKFLGASRGGLFENGEFHGMILNKQLNIDQSTLQGRLAQLHASGTVGFDGQLNLEVLVNTNQIIPETGQALVSKIPGLSNVLNRRDQSALRVANYLSNRLLKLRVTGTVGNPSTAIDPSVVVADTAVAFFSGVLKLPLGFVK